MADTLLDRLRNPARVPLGSEVRTREGRLVWGRKWLILDVEEPIHFGVFEPATLQLARWTDEGKSVLSKLFGPSLADPHHWLIVEIRSPKVTMRIRGEVADAAWLDGLPELDLKTDDEASGEALGDLVLACLRTGLTTVDDTLAGTPDARLPDALVRPTMASAAALRPVAPDLQWITVGDRIDAHARTLREGLALAGEDGAIALDPGTWTVEAPFRLPAHVRGAEGGATHLVAFGDAIEHGFEVAARTCRLENLELRRDGTHSGSVVSVVGGRVELRRCTVRGGDGNRDRPGHGIEGQNTATIVAVDSTFDGNLGDGIALFHGGAVDLRRCSLTNNARHGLFVGGTSRPAQVAIVRCLAEKNGASGFVASPNPDPLHHGRNPIVEVEIRNSMSQHNRGHGYAFTGADVRARLDDVRAEHNAKAGVMVESEPRIVEATGTFAHNAIGLQGADAGTLERLGCRFEHNQRRDLT